MNYQEIPLQVGWDHRPSQHMFRFSSRDEQIIPEGEYPFHVSDKIAFLNLSNNHFDVPVGEDFGDIYGAIDRRNGQKYLLKPTSYNFLQELHGKSEDEARMILKYNLDLAKELYDCGLLIPQGYHQIAKHTQESGVYANLNEWIVPNKNCASACIYCFAGQAHPEKKELTRDIPDRMPREVMRQIIADMPRSAAHIGAHHVHLKFGGGGEPAQAMDEVFEFLDLVKTELPADFTYDWVLITSGIGLSTTKLEEIEKRKGYIALSVGGDEEGHNKSRPLASGKGSFDIAMNQLRKIKAMGIPHNLTMALTSDNIDTAHKLLEKMYDDPTLGWSPIITSIARDNDHAVGRDFVPENDRIIAGWRLFLQTMIQGAIRFRQPIPPHFDYVEIGPEKKHTCIAGENYITAASVYDRTDPQHTIKPLISGCHVNATDIQHAAIPGERIYLEVAKQQYEEYGPYKLSSGIENEKPGCEDCDIQGWCAGVGDAGGCAIQKKGRDSVQPPYCDAYTQATELLAESILLADLYNGTTAIK